MDTRHVTLRIAIAQLTERSFIAVCQAGGITVRGQRSPDALSAVQALLAQMCGHDQTSLRGDGALALDLEIAGSNVNDLAALGDGEN